MNPGWFHGHDNKCFGDKLPRIYVGKKINSRTFRRKVAGVGRKKIGQRDKCQATGECSVERLKEHSPCKASLRYRIKSSACYPKSQRPSPSITTEEEKEKSRFGWHVFREVLGRGNLKCMNFAVWAADYHGSDLQGRWTTREAPTLPKKKIIIIPSSPCPSPRPQGNNLARHRTCMLYFAISDFWIWCQYGLGL